VVGLPGRKKFGDIFIRFDTIAACDRQTLDDSNSRAMQSVARVKTRTFQDMFETATSSLVDSV